MTLSTEQIAILDTIPDPVVLYDLEGMVLHVNTAFCDLFGYSREEVLGRKMDFVPEGGRSQLTGAVDILLRANTFLTPDTKRRTKEGFIRDVQINTSLLMNELGRPKGSVVVMRDITDRKRIEEAEREQRTLAEALNAVSLALNSTLELSEVLDLILVNVGRVLPHELAIVTIVEGDQARITGCKDYTFREKDRELIGRLLDIERTPTLRAMYETREPIIIPDFCDYPDMERMPDLGWLNSYIGAPILRGDTLIGFISVQRVLPGFFESKHAQRLQVFAGQAAIAIQNARLYEQARELAALSERQRIARELHDAVSQTLFSANVMGETLLLQAEQQPDISEKLTAGLSRLHELTQGALAEMRTLLLELRPEALVKTSLTELLEHLVNTVIARKDIDAYLHCHRPVRLEPDVHIAFYRIAQEAINNIVKHAQATMVDLTLQEDETMIWLEIRDNGVGFDFSQIPPGHLGLTSMAERAAALGARLDIHSEPDEGTTVNLIYRKEAR
ncbi:MAG: PAS domain S-box protein [bacterium]|nr:PAS domain S-box protein [bacterium]